MINRHQIESLLRYHFSNGTLLEQAFIRSSFANNNNMQGNEMLEFLGDGVLDLIVLEDLLDKNGACIDLNNQFYVNTNEGTLTKDKIKKVDEIYLSNVVSVLGLNEFLVLDEGDSNNNVGNEDSVKADLFEAIIGAVYIDSNKNIDITRKIIMQLFERAEQMCPEDKFLNEEDYVSAMNEWQFKVSGTKLVHSEEKVGDMFVSKITINTNGLNIPIDVFTGKGKNKKMALRNASKEAYEFIIPYFGNINNDNTIELILGDLNIDNCISQLNVLADKKIIDRPSYSFEVLKKEKGIEYWKCTCSINGFNDCISEEYNSKKNAKKDATWNMINQVAKKIINKKENIYGSKC